MLTDEATPDLRAAVVSLWEACGLTRPWNPPHRDLDDALAGPTSTVLVAVEDGLVLGSVLAGYDGHRGWLYYLAVAPDRRGAGLARTLITTAEGWLARQGARKVQLMVRRGNPAEAVYPALGYEAQDVAVYGRRLDG
ncbi:GNAT family acetyltransferase [Serinibacter arcticus]|uniref:GNAT family acetyltransferase n=1 Tax=Serinibacter arcticus TaxID=1655435 RepID=A0A2U1ZZK6_9MICO|nr:GNAT family acetyltransferase [Serinibacter arcticus]